jgi:chorismate mutase-like protein
MAPYRARIDALDRQIIELLRQRYAVINEVGHLKAREGLAPVLQDRVDEVRENAARLAAEAGLDAHFIRDLYAQLIAHSCATEENIMRALLTDANTDTRAAAE